MVPPFSPAEHCLSAPKGRLSANGRQVAGTGGKVADFGGKAAIVLADREPRWPAGSSHPQVATAHSGIRAGPCHSLRARTLWWSSPPKGLTPMMYDLTLTVMVSAASAVIPSVVYVMSKDPGRRTRAWRLLQLLLRR